jgi:hypothetical protein
MRVFGRAYFMHLGTIVLIVLTLTVILSGLLLLPSYLYVHGEVVRGREALALIDAAQLSEAEASVKTRSENLVAATGNLARLAQAPQASAALRAILELPRTGIALTGFTYAAANTAEEKNRMDVSGIADSREALRNYVAALDALPFVDSAELPISAYARETDIPFTITLTGTLKP